MNEFTYKPLQGLRAKRGTVSTKTPGLDFVRKGIAKALSGGNMAEAEKIAANRWGKNSRAALICKADMPALSTIPGSEGHSLFSQEGNASPIAGVDEEIARAEFVDAVRARSLIGRLGLLRVPFMVPFLVMENGPVAEWRDEGAAYAMPPLKMVRQPFLERYDVGALLVATLETLSLKNLDVELWIKDQLVKAVAEKIDRDFIDPANLGTPGVKPASITSDVTITAESPMTGSGEGIFDAFDGYSGDIMRSVLIMNPWRAAKNHSANREGLGLRGGDFAGIPVVTSTACPEEIVVLLDPGSIGYAMEGADVRMSSNASLEMETAPSMTSAPSVSGQNTTSMFQSGSVALIASTFVSWRVLRSEAVAYYNAPSIGLI
jgi:hypothetical protein